MLRARGRSPSSASSWPASG